MLETVSGLFANWWWLIAFVVAIAILRELDFGKRSRRSQRKGHSRRTGRWQRRAASRKSFVARRHPAHRVENPTRTITGKAYVTDGDGIRVDRQEIRLGGLDAPEWDQRAKHRDGYWFNHGKRVKSALIQEIGGKHVRVSVEDTDKFGRLLGTVTCEPTVQRATVRTLSVGDPGLPELLEQVVGRSGHEVLHGSALLERGHAQLPMTERALHPALRERILREAELL